MSDHQKTIQTLRDFNLWRRSDEDMDQPDPWGIGRAIDDAIEAMGELNEWRTLNGWGGTPEIINDFIKGQQSRIYAAQEAEEQRDRLAEALRKIDMARLDDFMGPHDMALKCVSIARESLAAVPLGAGRCTEREVTSER